MKINTIRMILQAAAMGCAVLVLSPTLQAQAWTNDTKTTSRKFIVERPTLLSLGFEWMIDGDINNSARVEVEFRKTGDAQWRKALPLFRLHPVGVPATDAPESSEKSNRGGAEDEAGPRQTPYNVPNAFAGSILNLEPNTEYEARFKLLDPDGVKGKSVELVRIRTRREPMPAPGGHVYHVYPAEYDGPKQEPAFMGILAAYYTDARNADPYNAFPPRVQPGDTILVHAGVYKDLAFRKYGLAINNHKWYGVFFDGTYYLTASGTPDKPIVIKGAGDGEAIIDGNGAPVLFDLMGANYNYFEGLTIRNAEVGFLLGRKHIAGGSGFTLKHCKIEDVARGVHGDWAHSVDDYIADNVFIGRHDPAKLMSWIPGDLWSKLPGFPNPISGPGGSEYAVKVYGQGNVIAYNKVSGFHDGIDNATYGPPDGAPDHVIEEDVAGSTDYYGNDMSNLEDNCFEADGGVRNMRIFDNSCFNSGQEGISYAPSYGGPLYVYRNLIYNNIDGSLKMGAWGVLFYQNTVVGEVHPNNTILANIQLRNNLIIGLGAYPEVLGIVADSFSSSDYNGFRTNPGAETNFLWADRTKVVVPRALGHTLGPMRKASIPGFGYKSLEEYCKASGQDCHSILIDYSDFVKASGTNRSDPTILYNREDYDFRLKPGSKAIDAGIPLPTINDDFTGRAPDLGAYEAGRPLPHYGPRTAMDATQP
jgi:hypothetical protein